MGSCVEVIVTGLNYINSEAISGLAVEHFGCLGVEELNLAEKEIEQLWPTEEGPFVLHQVPEEVSQLLSEQTHPVKFYFTSQDTAKEFAQYLTQFESLHSTINGIEDLDWNQEWKRHYEPIVISEDLRIVPSWYQIEDEQDLKIYPGQGFGTGSHETTFLCLKLMLELKDKFKVGARVLDFGCGSGILGIASEKILKGNVVYCDIDDAALENTKQNIALNFPMKSKSFLLNRSQYRISEYELVFANILYSALIEEIQTITQSVISGGYLILSGLLNEQVDRTMMAYGNLGFDVLNVKSRNDWSAILLQKR